jgi:hypothetical protein
VTGKTNGGKLVNSTPNFCLMKQHPLLLVIKLLQCSAKRNSLVCLLLLSGFLYFPDAFGQSIIKSNLPIVVVTASEKPIEDAEKVPAWFQIVANVGGSYTYNAATPAANTFDYEGNIGIEYRGNSSIHWPKKSYGFEMLNTNGSNKDVAVLGMGADNDWILNACYGDKSFLRDVLAHEMYRRTDRYSPNTRYVELFVKDWNGQMEYRGIYIMMEKIKKSSHRINVAKLAQTDSDPTAGGFIVQIGEDEERKWQSAYVPVEAPSKPAPIFHVEYPKLHKYDAGNANTTIQFNYIKGFVDNFENALKSANYKDPDLGYRKYIDVDAMVDYLLHEEFTKNVDNWRISGFFYKNRDSDGGKLVMGAPWDFDRAMGNQQWCFLPSVLPTGSWSWKYNQDCPDRPAMTVFWPERLLSDCYFKEKLMKRYVELRQTVWSNQNINNYIASQKAILTTTLAQTEAGVLQSPALRNFNKWNIEEAIMFNEQYPLSGNTYDKEVTYLNNWLIQHLEWMDANIESISTATCASLPVTFLGLDLKSHESGILVTWSTATETNNDRFEVQRSADGKSFVSIGSVKGAGESGKVSSYTFNDAEPFPGKNYYRIRQIDIDGTSSLSSIKAIENTSSAALSVLYPNPVKDEVSLKNVITGSQITVYNDMGKAMVTFKATQKQVQIPTAGWPAGTYQIRISDQSSGYTSSHKLAIVR